MSYGDIQKYTDIWFQRAWRMQFLGVKKWYSANVFSDIEQKYVCWKGFWLCCKSILFSTSSELRFVKWVRFFEENYCKMSNLFRYFLLALRLSARKSDIKKNSDVHQSIWTNIKKLYARNNILKKRLPNTRFWIINILVQI